MSSNKSSKRTIMYIDDDDTKPVMASGALIYRFNNKKMELLVIKYNNKYEDIGGKIDNTDKNIYYATAREVEEETNGIIKSRDIYDRLTDSPYIYSAKSKYIIFLVEATEDEKKLVKKDFGEYEHHDNIKRTIGWVKKETLVDPKIIKHKMNWRLKNRKLFSKLESINEDNTFSKRLF